MRQVTDSVLYDTENANLIFEHNSRSKIKTLYLSFSGRWFFHHYAENEHIEPIEEEDAFGFLQSRSNQPEALNKLLEHFSDWITTA